MDGGLWVLGMPVLLLFHVDGVQLGRRRLQSSRLYGCTQCAPKCN